MSRICPVHGLSHGRTNRPDELILTNYFAVRDAKIVSLIATHNTPAR